MDCFTRFSTLFGIKKTLPGQTGKNDFARFFFSLRYSRKTCVRVVVDCRLSTDYVGLAYSLMVVILVAWVALIVGSWGVGFQSWVFWFYLGLMDGCGYVGLAYYSTLGVILVSWVVVIMLSIIGLILATWISFGWLTQLWVLSWNNESFLDFMGGGDYTGMAYSAMKVILASWVVVIILGWLTQSWKLSWPHGWWWLYWGGLLNHLALSW